MRVEWKNFTVHFGQIGGAFHLTNTPIWNFGKSTWPMQRYIPVKFRSHIPDPSHRAFGYCSCKQDTKERYWGQQFCQMERDISVRPTEITWPVKVDHLEGWSQIFRSDRIEIFCSIWFLTEISGILGWAPWGYRGMHSFPTKMIKFWALGNALWIVAAGNSKCFVLRFKRLSI